MDKSDFYFDKLESILDKDQTNLLQAMREHHSSWDSHILTLSTAAVGFSFTFLPLPGSEILWLAIIGILSFALSIVFSTSGYLVADKGLEIASGSQLSRRLQHDKLRHRVKRLKREIEKLKPEDAMSIDGAREKCWNDVDQIYAERNPEKELEDLNRNNRRVNLLNQARTYSFLVGIIAVTIFSLCNISLFGRGL